MAPAASTSVNASRLIIDFQVEGEKGFKLIGHLAELRTKRFLALHAEIRNGALKQLISAGIGTD